MAVGQAEQNFNAVTGILVDTELAGTITFLEIMNVGAPTVYLGGSAAVTPADGFPLRSGISRRYETGDDLYAIADAGPFSGKVRVLERAS